MSPYLLRLDLNALSERLSHSLGCRLSVADVRGILENAGFVESPFGWLTNDMRPLMMVFARSTGGLG